MMKAFLAILTLKLYAIDVVLFSYRNNEVDE